MLKKLLPIGVTQRYLAANFVAPFVMSASFFVIFLLTFQLFRLISIVTNKDVEMSLILELMGHIAVSFLPMAIPLAALFAAIFTLNKMSEDSEVVAMRSFGFTKKELISPFLLMGVLIAGCIFALNRNLIPHSKTQFKNTIITLTSQGNLTNIKSGQFFTEIPGITLFAEEVSKDGSRLKDVFILQEKNGLEQVIFAKSGALIKQEMGKLRAPTLRLFLRKGNIMKQGSDDQLEKILFDEYDFPVVDGGSLPGLVTKDSMRSNDDLRKVIKEKKKRRAEILGLEKRKSSENRELNDIKKNLPKSELEYWSRFNTPVQVLLFIFLGFSIGIKKGRGRTKNSGSLGLFFLIGYYTIFFTGVSMARKGAVPPVVVVFLPTVLSMILGARLYQRLDWQS